MPKNYYTDPTGTKSYGSGVTTGSGGKWTATADNGSGMGQVTSNGNGYTQYYNPTTGTRTYGKQMANGDVYYAPRMQSAWKRAYTGDTGTPRGSGGGGDGAGYNPYIGPGYEDDIVNKIKALLSEQKAAADKYYKTMYENTLTENQKQSETARNAANLQYMRGDRYLKSMYGNEISGPGLSNMARNNSNWNNNLTSIRQDLANNNANALANYNMNKANTASQLAQGWYNYVLPIYTNRQSYRDALAYQNM